VSKEQIAWGRLSEAAPRGRYEHARTWEKRNRQRHNFVSRIQRKDDHWIWSGQVVKRDGKQYPMFAYRIIGGQREHRRQIMAFRYLVAEFFPELTPRVPQRTAPTCGEELCINPWHRANLMVTRQTINAAQAREIYVRRNTATAPEVAQEYGISSDQVLAIWRGRSWRAATGAPAHVPKRKVYDDATVWKVLELKGTGSSRQVAAQLDVGYKFVLDVWAGVRLPKASLPREQTPC